MSTAPHPLEPEEHRRARLLYVLKSMTDRGHTLGLKAADKAEAQIDAPDPTPDEPPAPPAPNYHQLFHRYVSIVRQLVMAEHRIATGTGTTRRHYRPAGNTGLDADPRRPKLREFIHKATRNSPDRAALRRDANLSLDEALDRDPALTLAAGAVLHEICQLYGLPFDLAKLPDDFLEPPVTGPPHIPK